MNRDIKEIISKMTLEEKAGLCSGTDYWHTKEIKRLKIPSIMVSDGPHGLRKQVENGDHMGAVKSLPSICFPAGTTLACSWDRDLLEKFGTILSEECQAEDIAIILGPAVNIKRSPLCGRNFEYFSEDPYLTSELAKSYIQGLQSQGVGASLKHYAANNQEHRRMTIDVIIDERTLREIYLACYEDVVKKTQPWTVMCSYNKVNGEFASENKYLLNDILKKEWCHEGFVISDWGAVNDRIKGLSAGLELEMPSNFGIGDKQIIDAVKEGRLKENILDKAVERLLKVIFKAVDNKKPITSYSKEAHHILARDIARECIVLLKNDDNILPLKREGTIAVIGSFAKNPRYQGGGSSHINPYKIDNIYEEINKKSGNAKILFEDGYRLNDDKIDEKLINKAKEIAVKSDVTLIFAGLPERYESEGYDREHLRIPLNHKKIIEEVSSVQKNVVVILSNGSPIEMPWIDKVKGVLEAYLAGEGFGGAIADILFGNVNPSGKLAETFPKKINHNPSFLNFPGEDDKVEYKEGLFVGYRYYDMKNIEPLFPFGYGLSYTNFKYKSISVNKKEINDNESVKVSVNIENIGKVTGKEIVQLYVKDIAKSIIRPEKELKGFAKIELLPDEEKTVSFVLDKKSFAYYNPNIKDWHVETGDFEILIGKSSQDILLKETIRVHSTVHLKKNVHRNTTIGDLLSDPSTKEYGEEIIDFLKSKGGMIERLESLSHDLMMAVLQNLPLRSVVGRRSGGSFSEDMLSSLISKINSSK